jgi:hypothetical protein
MPEYHLLTARHADELRRERVLALESDLYRTELALQDALSERERSTIAQDADALVRRLVVHYRALGLTDTPTSDHSAPNSVNGSAPLDWEVPAGA